MIALFDEPPRVTLRTDRYPIDTDQAVGLLLGIALESSKTGSRANGVVCLADGSVVVLPPAAYTLDWRYDVENDRFVDLSVAKGDQEG